MAAQLSTYLELVAANVTALDIANETVVLPVLRLADGSPSSTILDRRQGIWFIDKLWSAWRLGLIKVDQCKSILTVSGHSGRRHEEGGEDLHLE